MPTHYQGSKSEVRALNAFINLVRATDSLTGRMSGQLERQDLTMGQFAVLEALLHLGPMCQHAIAQKLLRSGGNITLVIDNLEDQGWVRRERQRDDRRMIMIHLTPAGRRLIEGIFPAHAKAIEAEMSRLSPREQEELRRLSRKLGRAENFSPKQKEKTDDAGSSK